MEREGLSRRRDGQVDVERRREDPGEMDPPPQKKKAPGRESESNTQPHAGIAARSCPKSHFLFLPALGGLSSSPCLSSATLTHRLNRCRPFTTFGTAPPPGASLATTTRCVLVSISASLETGEMGTDRAVCCNNVCTFLSVCCSLQTERVL